MKILGIETHYKDRVTNATDWWRCISPLHHLKRRGHEVEVRRGAFPAEFLDEFGPFTGSERKVIKPAILHHLQQTMRSYDVMHFSYLNNPLFNCMVQVIGEKERCAVSFDLDDNVLEPDLKNPIALVELVKNPNELAIHSNILSLQKNIVVTNKYLKERYQMHFRQKNLNKPIHIIPNYIDLEVYTPAKEKEAKKEVVIGFFGSVSHQADLYERQFFKAISRIRKLPNVRFEIIGNFIPDYLRGFGNVTLIQGEPDFYEWVKLWNRVIKRWDIGVAPLRDTVFNRCRSQIKYYEYAAALVPMVTSDIGHYTSDNVLKAKKAKDWYDHLMRLIEDPIYRVNLAHKALQEVKEKYTIQKNIDSWERYFSAIAYGKRLANTKKL